MLSELISVFPPSRSRLPTVREVARGEAEVLAVRPLTRNALSLRLLPLPRSMQIRAASSLPRLCQQETPTSFASGRLLGTCPCQVCTDAQESTLET